jgi:hypothetical protein
MLTHKPLTTNAVLSQKSVKINKQKLKTAVKLTVTRLYTGGTRFESMSGDTG